MIGVINLSPSPIEFTLSLRDSERLCTVNRKRMNEPRVAGLHFSRILQSLGMVLVATTCIIKTLDLIAGKLGDEKNDDR